MQSKEFSYFDDDGYKVRNLPENEKIQTVMPDYFESQLAQSFGRKIIKDIPEKHPEKFDYKDPEKHPEKFDYNEDFFLDMARAHIVSTYDQHYIGIKDKNHGDKNIQVVDLLISIGHAESFFIANAIKYLSRYGKKSGHNNKDLLKAIHYICLLLNLNHGEDCNETSR